MMHAYIRGRLLCGARIRREARAAALGTSRPGRRPGRHPRRPQERPADTSRREPVLPSPRRDPRFQRSPPQPRALPAAASRRSPLVRKTRPRSSSRPASWQDTGLVLFTTQRGACRAGPRGKRPGCFQRICTENWHRRGWTQREMRTTSSACGAPRKSAHEEIPASPGQASTRGQPRSSTRRDNCGPSSQPAPSEIWNELLTGTMPLCAGPGAAETHSPAAGSLPGYLTSGSHKRWPFQPDTQHHHATLPFRSGRPQLERCFARRDDAAASPGGTQITPIGAIGSPAQEFRPGCAP